MLILRVVVMVVVTGDGGSMIELQVGFVNRRGKVGFGFCGSPQMYPSAGGFQACKMALYRGEAIQEKKSSTHHEFLPESQPVTRHPFTSTNLLMGQNGEGFFPACDRRIHEVI